MSLVWCDRCEMSNCGHVTGADQRYEASLVDESGPSGRPIPHIPGGPTMESIFGGHCIGCGRRYDKGTLIHHDKDLDGWLVVECCVQMSA